MPPLNPKKKVISNRVLRRAVTRGVDTIWWAKLEQDKKKMLEESEQEGENGELNGLAVAMFVLFSMIFAMLTESC